MKNTFFLLILFLNIIPFTITAEEDNCPPAITEPFSGGKTTFVCVSKKSLALPKALTKLCTKKCSGTCKDSPPNYCKRTSGDPTGADETNVKQVNKSFCGENCVDICYRVEVVSKTGLECPCACSPGKLVRLSSLIATSTDKGVLLNWSTQTEPDSQGFKIWRAIPKLNSYCGCSENIDNYTQIQVLDKEGKPILISAKGNEISGFNYSHLDKEAKPGTAYCYALEDINSKGESKFYFEYVAFSHDSSLEEKVTNNNN